jgi:mycofactocin system FadH/OYE family oxidoreductase 2
MKFERLLAQVAMGSLLAKNRMAFPAHRTNLAGRGWVSDALTHYYQERAKGGCGLIVVGEFSLLPNDRPYVKMIDLQDRTAREGLKKLAGTIKEEGALAFGQLTHRGFQSQGAISRLPLWGPEPVADIVHGEVCKRIEQADIAELIESFAAGAARLKEAQFDGVEIDVGETSLLRQFLSPLTNHRQDAYGGELLNRLRLTREVLLAVKAAVGEDFPIGVRLCLDEIFWGALTLDESIAAAQELERLSLVDYFASAIGTYYNLYLSQASMHSPAGLTLEKAKALKEAVSVPVLAGNRIHTPWLAEQALKDGQADMIGWIRPLICDPKLPNKILEDRLDEIVFCVSDNQNCVGRVGRLKPVACIQNPWAGREMDRPAMATPPMGKRKKVVIVGAGPAGLQAGLTAASCGHSVTIYEREKEPGGQLRLARLGAGRQEIWKVVENLTRRLKKRDVQVVTQHNVTAQMLLAESPDSIIVATGSFPHPKPVPGNYSAPTVLNAWQALRDPDSVGERVILVDENGHHQAIATAEFLADHGRKVDIMTGEPFVGMELAQTGDLYLSRQRLLSKSVTFLPDRVLLEIKGNVLTVADKFTEEVSFMEGYHTIVLVMGNVPDDTLFKELKSSVPTVVRVGDCVAPRRIDMAILEGNRAALSL